MSKYTTEVRFICEQSAGLSESKGYNDIDTILTAACPKVFDFEFPIFDENYRLILEKKILKHYYTREICAETVGLWKLYLSARLNEIMPYYNKLYESTQLKFEPLRDVDLTVDHVLKNDKSGSNNGTDAMTGTVGDVGTHSNTIDDVTTRTANNETTTRDRFSDTPQGSLSGVENDNYLTTARKVTDETDIDEGGTLNRTDSGNDSNTRTYNTLNTKDETNTLNTTENYLEHITGKRGNVSYSKMLMEYRDSLINVDRMIINDLKDLFFGLW